MVRADSVEAEITHKLSERTNLFGMQGNRFVSRDAASYRARQVSVHQRPGSPAEALQWAQRGAACDLALLDFHMPDMNGLQLAQALHGLRGASVKQVLLTSGFPLSDADARQAGLLAQLSKPVKHAALFKTILRLFDQRSATPDVPGTLSAPMPVPPSAPALQNPLRILIVEDNAVNVMLLIALLELMGYRADVAVNGAEAVAALRRQVYDVILMDVQMPVMDGIEATVQIRGEWKLGRRPRIIALTAGVTPEEVQACGSAGMDDFLTRLRLRPTSDMGAVATLAAVVVEL
jgi:CheY-like chemotaxis protein